MFISTFVHYLVFSMLSFVFRTVEVLTPCPAVTVAYGFNADAFLILLGNALSELPGHVIIVYHLEGMPSCVAKCAVFHPVLHTPFHLVFPSFYCNSFILRVYVGACACHME